MAKVAAFRERALGVLRAGLVSKKLGPHGRAAFAVALGIAEEYRSVKPLVALVADAEADPELRAYGALGLGLIGQATRDVLEPLRGVISSAAPSGRLFAEASTALALLSDRGRQALLETRLAKTPRSDDASALVLAMARTGDELAVKRLLALLEDAGQSDLVRAWACAGLGMVGDLEFRPSLARLSRGFNYLADHHPDAGGALDPLGQLLRRTTGRELGDGLVDLAEAGRELELVHRPLGLEHARRDGVDLVGDELRLLAVHGQLARRSGSCSRGGRSRAGRARGSRAPSRGWSSRAREVCEVVLDGLARLLAPRIASSSA